MEMVSRYIYTADCGAYGKVEATTLDDCVAKIRKVTVQKRLHYVTAFKKVDGQEITKVWKYSPSGVYTIPLAMITRIPNEEPVEVACDMCGTIVSYRKDGMCNECHTKVLRESRIATQQLHTESVKKYTKIGCTTGVCHFVKSHHDLFAHDEERISSACMLNVMCGPEVEKAYHANKEEMIVTNGFAMLYKNQ